MLLCCAKLKTWMKTVLFCTKEANSLVKATISLRLARQTHICLLLHLMLNRPNHFLLSCQRNAHKKLFKNLTMITIALPPVFKSSTKDLFFLTLNSFNIRKLKPKQLVTLFKMHKWQKEQVDK